MRTSRRATGLPALLLLTTQVQVASAGPISPGNVREIDQACAEIGCFPGDEPGFPVTISEPGKYVLHSSLRNATDRTSSISVSTDGEVEIDLQRHGVYANTYGSGGSRGIRGNSSTTVRNGQVIANNTAISGARALFDVVARSIHGEAAALYGQTNIVRDSRLHSETGTGIACSGPCAVIDSDVSSYSRAVRVTNGPLYLIRSTTPDVSEINGGDGSLVLGSTIGFFSFGDDSAIYDSTIRCFERPNGARGSSGGRGFRLIGSSIGPDFHNADCGISVGPEALVKGNDLEQPVGVRTDSVVRDNTVQLHEFDRSQARMFVGARSIVRGNTIVGTVLDTDDRFQIGIAAGDDSLVRGNTITGVHDGIQCGEGCTIWQNTVRDYFGVGLVLGDTSGYAENAIDGSGTATVEGGIDLNP